ncbi:hypothetical protein ACJ73_10045, partial [Blastomyces percursus]
MGDRMLPPRALLALPQHLAQHPSQHPTQYLALQPAEQLAQHPPSYTLMRKNSSAPKFLQIMQ